MHHTSKIILEILKQSEKERQIEANNSLPPINEEKLNSSKNDVIERLNIKLKNGKYSQYLLNQLATHNLQQGEKHGKKIEYYPISQLLELFEHLESGTIKGEQFKDDLKEYFHIHHSPTGGRGYPIVRNVKEYWYSNNEIRKERINDFNSIIKEIGIDNISAIAISMHQEAISNKNLKGEWLIYKIHNGIKYYLCLATHNEGENRKETDQKILDMISKSRKEFPELNI